MNSTTARLAALVLAILLCCISLPALAEGDSDPDVVYDSNELSAWLANHDTGTVQLGADIALMSSVGVYGPVVIDTGSYSLGFNGGYLIAMYTEQDAFGREVSGKITITGSGVDHATGLAKPVLDVRHLSNRFGPPPVWNACLFHLNVTATGWEGKGGIAMRISNPVNGAITPSLLDEHHLGQIRAFGEGAVGLDLVGEYYAFFFRIAVDGPNSTAIRATENAAFCLGELSATGEGSQLFDGPGELLLDTCFTQPTPQDERIKVYTSKPNVGWHPAKLDSPADNLGFNLATTSRHQPLSLYGGSNLTRGLPVPADWVAACKGVDMSQPGRTTLLQEPTSPWLRTLFPGNCEMIIEVRDPTIPCIYTMSYQTDPSAIVLNAWADAGQDISEYRLLRSLDDGKSWEDCTQDPRVTWADVSKSAHNFITDWCVKIAISSSMLAESPSSMFLLELPEIGESNVAHFSPQYGWYSGDMGGDRIGTDRVAASLSGARPVFQEPGTDASGGSDESGGTWVPFLPAQRAAIPVYGAAPAAAAPVPIQQVPAEPTQPAPESEPTLPSQPAPADPVQGENSVSSNNTEGNDIPLGGDGQLPAPANPAANSPAGAAANAAPAAALSAPLPQPALPGAENDTGVGVAIALSAGASTAAIGGVAWLRVRKSRRRIRR